MSALAAGAAREGGVVVVGAGQSGGRAVEALRAAGFAGQITLVGEEAHPPYERPSLSKEMLGDLAAESVVWVGAEAFYAGERVELRLGVAAVAIDRTARTVALSDGAVLRYGVLILATGARARRLAVPGADHPALLYLRSLDDSRALRAALRRLVDLGRGAAPGRIAVVGAGFIGLEVAAAARAHGLDVVVIEAGERAMARAVPAEIGQGHAALHRRHGVDLRFGAALAAIEDDGGRPVLRLAGGDRLAADLAVVGIGSVPNAELAVGCGLAVEDGIVVDSYGATADPFVFAAGDVAHHESPVLGRHVRLESWQNAQNQAVAVARNVAGAPAPYAEVPWFWTDQFGVNLQIAGLPARAGASRTVSRGAPADGSGLLLEFEGERLVCAVGRNAPRDLRVAKDLIALGGPMPEGALADPATKLPELLRALRRDRQSAPSPAP